VTDDQFALLVHLVQRSQHTVVLSGAGLSVASGIPDFRSPGGLWETVDPERVASMDSFRLRPQEFWDFYLATWSTLTEDYQPNAGHYALADLETRGYLQAVLTQNIDGLHTRAGSQVVHELHGTTRTWSCSGCEHVLHHTDSNQAIVASDGHRLCPQCNCAMKPDVTLFGEDLPGAAWEAARSELKQAELLLVVGSSLTVEPVASLPARFVHHPKKRLVILTRDQTDYSNRVLHISEPLETLLPALCEALPTTR
jgi:NAD-dependent deacetylase